ncbi:hypothetical protein C8R44DRAFT_742514 [Mycena epipterygia]|nr:hypothetical protein C8R44DRAFT_742514 [Mycena epipterygia]
MSTAELRARLDALNATIETEEALVAERKKQKRKITRELDNLIFPVLTLPPEIVSLTSRFPHFACLCLEWREIGLADALLWTTPHLRFDEYYARKTGIHLRSAARIENFLASWVRRARGLPLTLTIHGDMMRCLGHDRAAALITRLAPQVKKLDLWLTGRFEWANRARSLPNLVHWPILEEVEIMAADNFRDIAYAFSLAPKLRVLTDNDGVLSPTLGTVPWSQITFFHCKLGKSLEHCSFYLEDDYDNALDDAPDTLSHPHLRRLLLDGLDNGLNAILPLLALPILETLELTELPTDPESVVDFLERHSSHVQELQMHQLLVKSLPQMPALSKLTLFTGKESFTGDVFRLLQCREQRFLPALEHICLVSFRSQERADYETMAHALAARWHRAKRCADVVQLRSFTLRIKLGKDELIEDFEELLSPVTELKAARVDVVVKIVGSM